VLLLLGVFAAALESLTQSAQVALLLAHFSGEPQRQNAKQTDARQK
jgi:hypothetical protein